MPLLLACLLLLISAALAGAAEKQQVEASAEAGDETEPTTLCALIETSARANGLPVEFFTRLIWKESTFRPGAISPKGAQGIAQFMPGTAALRRLADPFDPVEAIPASARYLRELAERFGNLGLAAAAYNAGEARAARLVAKGDRLPWETEEYVFAITGRPVEDWVGPQAPLRIDAGLSAPREPSCLSLAATLARPGAGADLVSSIAKAPWAPWGVQVAGNFSLNRAMASFSAVQRRYAGVIGDALPLVVRSVNRSRGQAPLFQIRLPATDRGAADAMCQKLRAKGGACVVMRN
jgi:soluble lytic murein transglycosylase-like protein